MTENFRLQSERSESNAWLRARFACQSHCPHATASVIERIQLGGFDFIASVI